jgi:metal-dependent amidase/aminoacylase/carboxypeptidase family protein
MALSQKPNLPRQGIRRMTTVNANRNAGFFCFIGSRSDREGTSGVHHASDFDFDETAMLHIVRFFCDCAERILDKT